VFKNSQTFTQKTSVLRYGFTVNHQFAAKTDRNSVFFGRDPYITDRLSITVLYMNFNGFWKIPNFCSKSIHISLWFFWKLLVCGKNWPKLHILYSWPQYFGSVIHNGHVFQFLQVFKNFKFSLKICRCAYGFTVNRQFAAKTDRNSVFLGRDPHILDRLYIMVLYLSFHGFSNFRSKSVCVSLRFYRKSAKA
jgi:hypothetical protein